MAEPQVVYVNPTIETENGKNADKILGFQNSGAGTIFQGTADALAPIMVQLDKVSYDDVRPDIPYNFDNFARALESGRTVVYRTNFRGQTVPKRWYEYGEDRQDIVTGVFADYFASPALNVVGYWLSGYKENEKDAENFLSGIEKRYPIDPNIERDILAAQIWGELGSGQTQTPGEPTSPSPTSPGVGTSTYYEVIRRIPVNGTAPELYEETEEGVRIKFQNNNKGG